MKESSDASLPVVVNIGNFKYDGGFRFESTRVQRYSGEFPDSFMLASGDLLLVMTCQTAGGEILGIPGRIPNDGTIYLHNQRMGRVEITRPDELDLSYLYYLFLSKTFNQHLVATSTGSKILHTAPGRIEDFTWQRPPVEEQRRIAAVLSAYDDLIENNARRIRVLEEMARALYREWFVHSARTRSAEEWREGTIADLFTLQRGYDLPAAKRVDGSVPIVSSSGITGYHSEPKAPAPGVVTGRYGTLGAAYFVDVPFWPLNTSLYVSDFKGSDPFFVHQTLQSLDIGKRDAAGAVPGVNRAAIHAIRCTIPPVALRERYGLFAEPIYQQVETLRRKNTRLRAARDLILPKLLSGQLSVERIPDPAEVAG